MINTTLCYIEKDNQYLMLLRNKKKNDINEGKWIGIGGKFEPGESAEECLLREAYEETGLTLTSYTLAGLIHFRSDCFEDEEMYLFTADGFTGTLRPDCREGELRWIPKDEVLDLNLWEGDQVFLKRLMAGERHLDITLRYRGDVLEEAIVG
ncbi:MAG: 8-oxo-dGTP diphosphatase [Roseburia sp.]|nr:8-oxo-dGTP diphosphatase [Roseburia sp.]